MPQTLSESVEDKVRQYVVQNLASSDIEGYDPQQSDTTASDYILITSDNDQYGDYYPLIFISEQDGPTIPDSGNTNFNGIQGDGSGANTYSVYNVTIQVQAVENGPYLNNTSYDDLVFTIYQALRSLFGGPITLDSETLWTGGLTPGTQTRSSDENDSGSTDTWVQRAGTLPVGVQYTP